MRSSLETLISHWRLLTAALLALKLAIVLTSTPLDDLVNWANLAQLALLQLSQGHLPMLGVYGYMALPLVPFYWIWAILPIDHPTLRVESNYLFAHSTPAFYLNLLLKTPLFLSDIGAGVLVYKITEFLTGSKKSAKSALLVWFANPFNIYWINFDGAVDIVPTVLVLFSIYLCLLKRMFASGLCLAIGGILRIFPFVTIPFFLTALRGKGMKSLTRFSIGWLAPPALALLAIYVSKSGNLETLSLIPTSQTWLLDFLGSDLFGQNVRSAIVLVVLQLLVCSVFWKRVNYLNAVTAAILALFVSSLAYAGSAHHFMWVSPLLTISVASNPREVWAFLLTFASAFGVTYPFQPGTWLIGPFLTGIFYGTKSIYLLIINRENIQANQLGTQHRNSLIETPLLTLPSKAGEFSHVSIAGQSDQP